MKKICFFNHLHNGDIFNNKAFVEEIMSNIDTTYYYAHSNNPDIIKDLNLEYLPINSIGKFKKSEKIIEEDDVVYVNTWIGSSFGPENEYTGNCSLIGIHYMFGEVYEKLNNIFGTNLKLSNPEDYLPTSDYSKFNISNVDDFVSKNKNNKILFCNGPCLSGQCEYIGDMKSIIVDLSQKYPNKIFIATHKFECSVDNIKFTDDIIQSNSTDLNEIAYLSSFCDIIVGRSSGPLCFCCNKENINDPSKTFYVFGTNPTDCPAWNLNIESNFIFEYFTSLESITKSLFEILEK
jgi:hypothetical protein